MAEDFELPVWGVRPNWADPVLETLEWQSDVLTSVSGAEQRIAYRLAPRRLIEARYNPFDNERTFTDLALQRLGSSEWMMPLFFDAAKMSLPAPAGATRLVFSTAYHEFAAGGMAYLVGPDCFSGEPVRIASVDATGIDLDVPLASDWGVQTLVHPMRRGRFESVPTRMLTSRVSELRLRFEIVQGNDLPSEGTWATTSDGFPVLTAEPEWSEPIDIDFTWLTKEFDSETGLKYVADDAGRAFRQQRHAFLLFGAQEQFEFRQMLYRLRGRQMPVWVPTHADDFTVAAAAAAGAEQIDIERAGYAYVGGPADGRDRLFLPDGQIVQINAVEIVPGGGEQLSLDSPTTAHLAAGDRLSFIESSRLAADSVEIEHLGDTDGVARSSLAFVGFANRRAATTATSGIPLATMNGLACGTAAFTGLSWRLPNLGETDEPNVCFCPVTDTASYVVGGEPGTIYDMVLRVRGVVELIPYTGGEELVPSYLYKNATGDSEPILANYYKLTVSNPPAVYFFNNGPFDPLELTVLDYTFAAQIEGGATITLHADSVDGREIKNTTNASAPDNDPIRPIGVEQPYDGQFLQIDGEVVP